MRGLIALICLAAASPLHFDASAADELYKYRDANGNLVYADHKPDSPVARVESFSVPLESKAPRIDVQPISAEGVWRLQAINECQCVVEYGGQILEAHNLHLTDGTQFHATLTPGSQQTLLEVAHTSAEGAVNARIAWKAILGNPGTEHKPHTPYRVPFAVGTTYQVSQAFPARFTHVTPEDQYAVDIALPDGTPVDAAREGTVINVRHDKFLSAANPVMLDQANMVEILHDDGTIAIYAHLHWDSVRVHPGQFVRRGEYIANSGNTGFSTGAHLHFGVIRNAGMSAVSVPIQFAGSSGSAVTPETNMMLTAY